MKLKETIRAAHIAWSPSKIHPCFLACGTAAQQLDASFSTASTLDLLKFDLNDNSYELGVTSTITTESRFNKLIWSNYENNILIGGCENGAIYLYDYEKLIQNSNSLINRLQKHTGVVGALDLNPFQTNLLASGAGSSEIFIWDLNDPNNAPMTPGQKIQPPDDIQHVAWNNQVQHILASTSSGRCFVWDLRKNESIIKISDSISKLRAKTVAWHPDVATQLCLSSEDDHSPYLQLWDLRFATSPVKILEGHQRGILTFTWCKDDSNLLLSCGKDNRILCWNPQVGDIIYEIPSSQWCFDVAWCPRYPQIISSASYESVVSVYSLMGGKYDIKPETTSKIMDSFGGFASQTPMQPPQQTIQTQIIPQLKIAPKWMKRTCGASFGFGGKLVTFGDDKTLNDNSIKVPRAVSILQVTTDKQLVEKSQELEDAIQNGLVYNYCMNKVQSADNRNEQEIWEFLIGSFNQDKKILFKNYLGFNKAEFSEKIQEFISINTTNDNQQNEQVSINDITSKFDSANINGAFDQIKPTNRSLSPLSLSFDSDVDNMICQSLILGEYELAVELCFTQKRYSDAILIATHASQELFQKTQERYFKENKNQFSKLLEGFLTNNWQNIIDSCLLSNWKEALCAILSYTDGQEMFNLCETLGNRLENDAKMENNLYYACICYICSTNLNKFVSCWLKLNNREKKNAQYSAVLQDLIEKSVILRYGYQYTNNTELSSEALNDRLIEYANCLAEQGCFLTAYNYIKDKNDKSLAVMKDRLYNSIGITLMQQYGFSKPENPFRVRQAQMASTSGSNLSKTQFNKQQPNSFYQQQKVTTFESPQNNIPTIPTATDSFHQSHFQQSIPAMTSNSLITNSRPPTQNLFNSRSLQPQQNSFNQPPTGPSTQQPTPSHQNTIAPSVGFLNQKRTTTPNIPQYTQDSFYTPQAQAESNPNINETSNIVSYQNVKPASGWNDPPMVQAKIKAPSVAKETEQVMNFYQPTMSTSQSNFMYPHHQQQQQQQQTQPLFNPPPQQQSFNQLPPPPSIYNSNQFRSQTPSSQNIINQQPPLPSTTSFINQPPILASTQVHQNGLNTIPSTINNLANQQPVQNTFTPISPSPVNFQPPKVEAPQEVASVKQPLSNEHVIIKNVFDALITKCSSMANTLTNKRKIDDCSKKLEILYDKLRDRTLSDNVIHGLHEIIQCIQRFDYNSALANLTNLIAKSNFSEISGFMPSVKVLIQLSQQMNITL